MEEFFQILIIVIFILSSIASSRKKKKNAQAKSQSAQNKVTVPKAAEPSVQTKKSSSDILEEMLGFKINLPEPPKQEAPPVYSEDSTTTSSTWDPTKDYEDNFKEVYQDGTSDYQSRILAKKTELLDDTQKHRAFKTEVVKTKSNQVEKKVKSLFNSKSDLKDYIIIQEILNKPKALRR